MKNTLVFLVLFAALIAVLNHQFPGALTTADNHYHLIYLAILLLVVGGGVIATARSHWRRHLKHASIWAAIFLVIMLGYSYQHILLDTKIASELIPGRSTITGDGRITLHARADGHFYINGYINNRKLLFMIDTGASHTMLTQQTAERVGVEIGEDARKQIFSTANGLSAGHQVILGQMRIGNIIVKNAEVYISQGRSNTNLLGQSFLNQLSGYSVSDGAMTLIP